MTNPIITDAEAVLVRYKYHPNEDMSQELAETVESLLDLLAEYNVGQEYGIYDDVEYDSNPDDEEFDLDPTLGVEDETDYEG